MRKFELALFFDFIDAWRKFELQFPVEWELHPENSVKG
jgi:hypothetical protein